MISYDRGAVGLLHLHRSRSFTSEVGAVTVHRTPGLDRTRQAAGIGCGAGSDVGGPGASSELDCVAQLYPQPAVTVEFVVQLPAVAGDDLHPPLTPVVCDGSTHHMSPFGLPR